MSAKETRVCVITGAAGGIGQVLSQVFHEADFCVIATDCVPQPDSLKCTNYLQADLGHFAKDETYADKVLKEIRNIIAGRGLCALINNAAIQILGGADTLTRNAWQETLDINLLAPFLLTQALLPELEAVKGSVVNIGSIHARLTKRNFVAYATSKAALAGMTRALAVDLGARVRINAIEPAAIDTPMLKAGFTGAPELFDKLEKCHPQLRIGQPREVALMAMALVDDRISFLNGACIPVDGGIGGRLFDPE